MPRTDVDALLLAAVEALAEHGPMHYTRLTERMVEAGWVPPAGKTAPDYKVYQYLALTLPEPATPFERHKGGIFALKGQDASAVARPAQGARGPGRHKATGDEIVDAARARERAEAANLPQTCGYCRSASYHGVHELHLVISQCDADEESGRPYNRFDAPGCPNWRPRTPTQRASDQQRSLELQTVLRSVNLLAHRGQLWEEKLSKWGRQKATQDRQKRRGKATTRRGSAKTGSTVTEEADDGE